MSIEKIKYIFKKNIFIFRELSYLRLRQRCLRDHSLGEYYLSRFFPCDFSDKKNKDFKVIDIGCSWGRFGAMLSKHDISVYGIDPFIAQIKFWHRIHAENKNARFAGGEGQHIPFKSGTFDACIMIGVLEFIQDEHLFFNELKRILKPNAIFLLQITNRHNLYSRLTGKLFHKDYKRCYSLKQITKLLNSYGFSVYHLEGEGARIPLLCHFYSIFLPYFKTLSYHTKIVSGLIPLELQSYITIFSNNNGTRS